MQIPPSHAQVAPRFAGVHREYPHTQVQNDPAGPVDRFIYDGEEYYTTEKDSALLNYGQEAELVRSIHAPDDQMSPLQIIKKHLAQKEPNNQFKQALAERNEQQVLTLLSHPEVRLSATDNPQEANLNTRLRAHKQNFKFLTQSLGGKEQAKAFVQQLIEGQAAHDFADDASSGRTMVSLTPQQMAEAIFSVEANQPEASSPAPQAEPQGSKILKKMAFWKK